MPNDVIVLNEQPIMNNPICEKILFVCFIILCLSGIVAYIALIIDSIFNLYFIDYIFDIASILCAICMIMCLISIFGTECIQYNNTGLKKYTVIAQTEEQIEYIYDNYDITGSDGNIYYIEERTEQ